MSLFSKKKPDKQEELEKEKLSVLYDIVEKYKKAGYSDKQIKKLFIEKHYPIDFIDFILTELKGGKNMVKKKEYIEEDEEEVEEEDEEEFEEEEEDEVPKPQYKNVKPKEVIKKEVPKDTFKQEVIEAIKNLNLRISGIESSLYRAGVLR